MVAPRGDHLGNAWPFSCHSIEAQVEAGIFETIDKAITHEFAMLPQYTTSKFLLTAMSR